MPFVDKRRDFMCINAVQMDHDQELFFFFLVDICQAGFCLLNSFFKPSLYPLLHIVLYACKMFPFEQIVHNRIRGGLNMKRKSEAI